MTRAESGPDLRYEVTCGGGGGGGGGGGTSRMYYSRRYTVNDQNSDGYWWVPAWERGVQGPGVGCPPAPSRILEPGDREGPFSSGQPGNPGLPGEKCVCPRSRSIC
jgi:hypothetical protein